MTTPNIADIAQQIVDEAPRQWETNRNKRNDVRATVATVIILGLTLISAGFLNIF